MSDSDSFHREAERILRERAENVSPEDEARVHRELDAKMREASRAKTPVVRRLLDEAKLLWEMLRNPAFKMPGKAKAILIAGLIYFISPIDLIPDFIPGLGYVDDAFVIALVIKSLRDVIEEYRRWRGGTSCDEKPRG
jgi:uncharacterized membrane protein YkvA (DUF1232 family)